jgi:hypothetical protein
MKMIVAAAALAAVIASPAVAQDLFMPQPRQGTEAYAQSWPGEPAAEDAFASAVPNNQPSHSDNPAWDVYDTTGEYVGSDPDPFIRNELARDPPFKNDD